MNTSMPMRPLLPNRAIRHDSIRQQIVVIADFSRWLSTETYRCPGIWTARSWIDSCDFVAGSSGSAEAIRKRWRDCWPCFARKAL